MIIQDYNLHISTKKNPKLHHFMGNNLKDLRSE